jgi:hypothetical protein
MDAWLKRSGGPANAAQPKQAKTAHSTSSKPSSRGLVACPVCARQVPLQLINGHIDSPQCLPIEPPKAGASAAGAIEPPAVEPPVEAPTMTCPTGSGSVVAAGKPGRAPTVGAFATMMDSARQASRVLHCRLRRVDIPNGYDESSDPTCASMLAAQSPRWELRWSWHEPCGGAWSSDVLQLRLSRRGASAETKLRLHIGAEAGAPRHPRVLWRVPPPPDVMPGALGLSVSQLKSALQKNVRLCRPAAAVRVAWALVAITDGGGRRVGESELLRRLPIIAIEDVLPHPHLAAVVWMMAAHAKGMPLTGGQLQVGPHTQAPAIALHRHSRPSQANLTPPRQPSHPTSPPID